MVDMKGFLKKINGGETFNLWVLIPTRVTYQIIRYPECHIFIIHTSSKIAAMK